MDLLLQPDLALELSTIIAKLASIIWLEHRLHLLWFPYLLSFDGLASRRFWLLHMFRLGLMQCHLRVVIHRDGLYVRSYRCVSNWRPLRPTLARDIVAELAWIPLVLERIRVLTLSILLLRMTSSNRADACLDTCRPPDFHPLEIFCMLVQSRFRFRNWYLSLRSVLATTQCVVTKLLALCVSILGLLVLGFIKTRVNVNLWSLETVIGGLSLLHKLLFVAMTVNSLVFGVEDNVAHSDLLLVQ